MKSPLSILAAFAASSCFGVVATTSTSIANPVDSTWSWVGQMNGASAVAVGPRTVLTARHVGAGDFFLNGSQYAMTGWVGAPNETDGTSTTQTDLILVNLNRDLPGWYNIALPPAPNSSLTMVGFGGSGVVNGAGNGYAVNVGAGNRRAGGNLLDGTVFVDTIGFSHYSYLRTAGNAALVVGDSGGGWFDSSGNLIGINSFVFNDTVMPQQPPGSTSPAPPPPYPDYGFANANTAGWHYHTSEANWTWNIDIPANTEYFGSGSVDVTNAQMRAFIAANSAVPEPATLLAIGVGVAALVRRRRS